MKRSAANSSSRPAPAKTYSTPLVTEVTSTVNGWASPYGLGLGPVVHSWAVMLTGPLLCASAWKRRVALCEAGRTSSSSLPTRSLFGWVEVSTSFRLVTVWVRSLRTLTWSRPVSPARVTTFFGGTWTALVSSFRYVVTPVR